jgi:hypothetical protein
LSPVVPSDEFDANASSLFFDLLDANASRLRKGGDWVFGGMEKVEVGSILWGEGGWGGRDGMRMDFDLREKSEYLGSDNLFDGMNDFCS